MMRMATPLLELERVDFSYNGEKALEEVSFSVAAGDYIGIVGGNGSGKTTLLKVMLGLLPPDQGTVRLFGEPLSRFRDWSKVGYVPQHIARAESAFPATVGEVVASGLPSRSVLRGPLRSAGERTQVDEALRRAGIADFARRRIGELSGGERQRVFIARALVSRPSLLVLDEPTTGVDVRSEAEFYAFLGELNRNGITIILVSHDLDVVAREVGTVIALNRRVVCQVPSEEFVSGDYLKQLYGEGARFVPHHHHG